MYSLQIPITQLQGYKYVTLLMLLCYFAQKLCIKTNVVDRKLHLETCVALPLSQVKTPFGKKSPNSGRKSGGRACVSNQQCFRDKLSRKKQEHFLTDLLWEPPGQQVKLPRPHSVCLTHHLPGHSENKYNMLTESMQSKGNRADAFYHPELKVLHTVTLACILSHQHQVLCCISDSKSDFPHISKILSVSGFIFLIPNAVVQWHINMVSYTVNNVQLYFLIF